MKEKNTGDNYPLSDNAIAVLNRRYFLKNDKGEVFEDWPNLCLRVANHIAADEKTVVLQQTWAKKYYDLIHGLFFIPNTPTLMNAGKPNGQLAACFVLPVEDDMTQIMQTATHAALIHKSGGGTGFSFGNLRPKNSRVKTTSGVASGPVTFMKMYNDITECIKQGGTRRGANMGILPVHHPDILDFIDCKQDVTQITNFNISVGITDDFMKALKANEEYDLIDPHTKAVVGKLKAKTVFDKIVKNAWQTGEPGIFFIDNANATNKYGHIEATNPCGEQPLRANEACTLGSLNISNYVFNSEFDWDLLEEHIVAATRFLDSVVSVNHYPIDIIEKTHKETRKIGLGVMGFADALIDMGIIYGSDASIKFGEELFEFINSRSKLASIELGKEKGICKACLDLNLPYRNYWTTTVAPTGTISIIANCSSGIEPIFAVAYERNVMDKTRLVEFNAIFKGMMEELDIEISAELSDKIAHSDSIQKIKEIPEHIRRVFVTASDVTPEQHVKMQAAFQKHCDSGVSKTINLPSTATIEDVKTAYLLAYELKCKGITVYRDGSRPEQVLSTKKADKKEKAIWKRPSLVPGFTEKVDSSLGRLYITTNYKEDGSPVEVFLHIGSSGADINALFEGIGKLISLSLQNDIPANKVGKRLKGIQGEEKVIADNKKYASLLDLIGKRLESAYKEKLEEDKEEQSLMMCPECEVRVYRAENCYKCMSCGWSKC